MPFTIRPHRRFPVFCHVTYHAGLSQGQGIVWNISLNGWRLSGNLPLRVGQIIPLTVTLPNQHNVFVAAAIVRWKRDQEYGLETLVMEKRAQRRLGQYMTHLVERFVEVSLENRSLPTMSNNGKFWEMERASLFVYTSCYEQVYWKKIPPKCPQCGAFSMYDHFDLNQTKEWGSPELIEKAVLILHDPTKDKLEHNKVAIDS